jgi:hypothetical protein
VRPQHPARPSSPSSAQEGAGEASRAGGRRRRSSTVAARFGCFLCLGRPQRSSTSWWQRWRGRWWSFGRQTYAFPLFPSEHPREGMVVGGRHRGRRDTVRPVGLWIWRRGSRTERSRPIYRRPLQGNKRKKRTAVRVAVQVQSPVRTALV